MNVVLSTIGSRGDVQPLVALAMQLRAVGLEARFCVPPDFKEWIEGLGFPVTPVGPELRKFTAAAPPQPQGTPQARPAPPAPPSLERRRQLAEGTVKAQFEAISAAAKGCDAIVGATALQIAARSVAELSGIPYVFVAYCPVVLPSLHHAPPPIPMPGLLPAPPTADKRELWAKEAARFTETFGIALNAHRASLGLEPVRDVLSHVITDQPWLAADNTLGPWPHAEDRAVFQPGAWIVPDERPLEPELE